MKILPGEFIIVKGVGNTSRPKLVKCLEVHGKQCTGYLDVPSTDDDSKSVTFDLRDVITNLGKYPQAGSVYGVKIEPLLKVFKDKRFGEIRVYQKMKDDLVDRLMNELDIFYSNIKSQGHHKIPYHLEVRNPVGKYAGFYRYLPKAEQDILCIKPQQNLEGLQYILLHEHGHGVFFRRCNSRTRNKWIKLYHTFVALSGATEDDLTQILEEIHSVGSIGDYLKDADDETRAIVKACLRYISQVHGLGKHHLENALSIQDKLDDYWPVTALDFSQKELVISDYSRKSPEEFFAEAYSFSLLGRPLAKKVDSLLIYTLSKLTVSS